MLAVCINLRSVMYLGGINYSSIFVGICQLYSDTLGQEDPVEFHIILFILLTVFIFAGVPVRGICLY
jgi:hypothetical protein